MFLWKKPRRSSNLNRNRNSLQQRGAYGGASPHVLTPTPRTPRRKPHHDSKKSGEESESEESGYGETYYTMHASSFDTNGVFDVTSETLRGSPVGLEMNNFSDDDSTVSYIVGNFPPVNPEDLKDAMCQTPGHAMTQTDTFSRTREMGTQVPRDMQTQTPHTISMQTSNVSLHSIGNQTRRSSGSRTDLLRSILMDVQSIKRQRGVDSGSSHPSEEDSMSLASQTSLKRSMLQKLSKDVRTLKDKGSRGEAGTQTLTEQNTQTSLRIFPEGDPNRIARHGILNDLVDEVRHMRGSKNTSRTPTPFGNSRSQSHSRPSSRLGFVSDRPPLSSSVDAGNRATPQRFGSPKLRSQTTVPTVNAVPQHNGYAPYVSPMNASVPLGGMNATAPAYFGNYSQPMYSDRRHVTADDLNNISDRLERLRNYQIPPRRVIQPPPPPQYYVPFFAPPPRRRPRSVKILAGERDMEDGFLSDESEYEGEHSNPRRRRRQRDRLDHYNLDNALDEALKIKRMSQRLRDSIYDKLF